MRRENGMAPVFGRSLFLAERPSMEMLSSVTMSWFLFIRT